MSEAAALPAPMFRDLRALGLGIAAALTVFGGVIYLWGSERGAVAAAVCAAPALLALALSATSQAERDQYTARLAAAALMPPVGLLMWASAGPASAALLIALAFALAAAFCGAIVVFARQACAIGAAPGVARVPASTLALRLRSLPLGSAPATDADLAFELEYDAQRSHRVLLVIDERAGAVHVRERLGARAAAPRDAAEASLRRLGDAAFDPARPDAALVGSAVAQATPIEPAALHAVRLAWSADGQTVAGADRVAGDSRALVTLLAAVVTRSGYAWRPRLFGRG